VVLVASIVSIELGVTVALLELTLGVVVGNVSDLHSQPWLDCIASFGSIVLVYLAVSISSASIRCSGAQIRDTRPSAR